MYAAIVNPRTMCRTLVGGAAIGAIGILTIIDRPCSPLIYHGFHVIPQTRDDLTSIPGAECTYRGSDCTRPRRDQEDPRIERRPRLIAGAEQCLGGRADRARDEAERHERDRRRRRIHRRTHSRTSSHREEAEVGADNVRRRRAGTLSFRRQRSARQRYYSDEQQDRTGNRDRRSSHRHPTGTVARPAVVLGEQAERNMAAAPLPRHRP